MRGQREPAAATRLLRLLGALLVASAAGAQDPADVYSEDFARHVRLSESPFAEMRVAGVQGFAWLRDPSAEPHLLRLARDAAPEVRREVAYALGRLGRRDSVPVLVAMLEDPDVWVKQHARLALQVLTQVADPSPAWWRGTSAEGEEQKALAALKSADAAERTRALKALRCFAGPEAEPVVLDFAAGANGDEQGLVVAILECIGTEASLPWLSSVAEQQPAAAWALGRIGGPQAEEALLRGLRRFWAWDPQHLINLDRVHSARCGEFVPGMLGLYGCVTYRGQPENLTYDPTPLQRVCTNLILRSGRGPEVVECVLDEMEGCATDEQIPADLRPVMVAMRPELAPGFVRDDGWVTSYPMTAMSQLIQDRRLAPRLVPLLRHPAFVARIYAAMALGRLHATEALPSIVDVVEEGYPFADPMELASGKHFGESQTVRWRGFLCMAVGRMGGEEARLTLERWCRDPEQYRDIRYGSVVGLGFIGSPKSLPVLREVARDDLVWRIRVEAQDVAHRMEIEDGHANADGKRGR